MNEALTVTTVSLGVVLALVIAGVGYWTFAAARAPTSYDTVA